MINNYLKADDFHKKAQSLIAWLAGAERQLRYKGALPDDDSEIIKQIEEHKAFEEEFLRQEGILRETLNIGQDIMKRCHPDAISTLKHWLSVLKSRWEEVSGIQWQGCACWMCVVIDMVVCRLIYLSIATFMDDYVFEVSHNRGRR